MNSTTDLFKKLAGKSFYTNEELNVAMSITFSGKGYSLATVELGWKLPRGTEVSFPSDKKNFFSKENQGFISITPLSIGNIPDLENENEHTSVKYEICTDYINESSLVKS